MWYWLIYKMKTNEKAEFSSKIKTDLVFIVSFIRYIFNYDLSLSTDAVILVGTRLYTVNCFV